MFIIHSIDSQNRNSRSVFIDCPACRTSNAPATAFAQDQTFKLFFVIPVFNSTVNYVKCHACRKTMRTRGGSSTQPGGKLQAAVIAGPSRLQLALAIVALFLCVIPFLGILSALLAIGVTIRTGGMPRVLSFLALIAAAVITGSILSFTHH